MRTTICALALLLLVGCHDRPMKGDLYEHPETKETFRVDYIKEDCAAAEQQWRESVIERKVGMALYEGNEPCAVSVNEEYRGDELYYVHRVVSLARLRGWKKIN